MPHATPLNQRVLPDGSVIFEFEGHIFAEGLDLFAGVTGSPPADNRVRWLRESNGGVVASVYAFSSVALDSVALVGGDDTGPIIQNNDSAASLVAISKLNHIARVAATAQVGGLAQIRAVASHEDGVVAPAADVKVVDEHGGSTFVRNIPGNDGIHNCQIAWHGFSAQLSFYIDGTNVFNVTGCPRTI